jgi:hypothetical protein
VALAIFMLKIFGSVRIATSAVTGFASGRIYGGGVAGE